MIEEINKQLSVVNILLLILGLIVVWLASHSLLAIIGALVASLHLRAE